MHHVFPTAELQSEVGKPIRVVQRGMESLRDLIRNDKSIGGMCLNVWNRVIEVEKAKLDPFALASHIKGGLARPSIYGAMAQVLGARVIKDISTTVVHIDDPALEYDVIAKLCIAHVYPNDLHLADVYFQDPYRPLPTHLQKYEVAEHHGYGLLGLTLQRVEAQAKQLGCKHVTLTCAAADLVPLFGKHGYARETGERGRLANAMDKRIDWSL